MPRFDERQREAIESRGQSLLVSAAAGSGKTTVLVERILGLLREGADPAGLLVVTFTQAAAAEMRDRLRLRLEQLAAEETALQEALDRLPLASISTIHAFCKQLLDRWFDRAGLEAGFKVLDEESADRLRRRAMDETLDELYLDETLEKGLSRLGDQDKLRLEIEKTHDFLMSQPDPWDWLEEALKKYREWSRDPENAPWRQELIGAALRTLKQALVKAESGCKLAQEAESPYLPALLADVEALRESLQPPYPIPAFGRLPAVKKQAKREVEEKLQALRDGWKKQARKGVELMEGGEQDGERLQAMLPALEALAVSVQRYDEKYALEKREVGGVDFSDLEQGALRLLEDAQLRAEVQARYAHVFVDEYQDSSAVQEAILSRVSRPDNRFLVGDVKQSIYRFRQAEPSIFLSRCQEYGQGKGGRLIALNRNFRSDESVLEAVNLVFSQCMTGGDAEIVYDEETALKAGQPRGSANPVRLSVVERTEDGEKSDIRRAQAEALNAARLIRQSLGLPVRDGDKERPASYRDMVILLRSPRSLVRVFQDTLLSQGIPVYAEAGGSYYDTWEVRAALDYLTALDNPRKDLPLLGALTGLGGFTPEELARIRLLARELRWYSALKLYAQRGEDERLKVKVKAFLDRLWEHRRLSRQSRVSQTLLSVLEDTGFLVRCLGLPQGRTRKANLQALCLRAAAFDGPGDSLSDFLEQSRHAARRSRDGDTPTLTEKDDVVRILSVHKSKGLEFPIVIGCGLSRRFNLRADADEETGVVSTLLLDRELGLGLGFFDPETRVKGDTPACAAIREKQRRQAIAEEMRILYVLMTRPKDRLILSAAVDDADETAESWALAGDSPASCPLDWIGRAVMRAMTEEGEQFREARRLWQVERIPASRLQEEAPDGTPKGMEEALSLLKDAPFMEEDPFLDLGFPKTREAAAPQKQSVLQSIHWGEKDVDFIHSRPKFLKADKARLTPVERGSAVHEAMRRLELEPLRGLNREKLREAVAAQLEGMRASGSLTQLQYEAVEAEQLCTFLAHPIGRRLLDSTEVCRERSFVRRRADGSLVQGVIDLCFRTEGGWVLVDFKTDRRGLDDQSVTERHGPQVQSYAAAMEEAGLHVLEKAVYLFAAGRAVML